MKRGVVIILLAVLLLALRSFATGQSRLSSRSERAAAQTALEATVQISLVAPRVDAAGRPLLISRDGRPHFQLIYDEGLGTAVHAGDRNVIITHDHWCELTPRLLFVEIRTYDGELLSILEANVFKRSIIYRDGGAMAFLAPETVATNVTLHDHMVIPGDTLQVVRQSPATGKITAETARLDSRSHRVSPTSRRLEMSSGQPLQPGDSGAGVWHDGLLVGALWAVVEETTGDRTCTPRPTAVCIVAILPPLDKLAR